MADQLSHPLRAEDILRISSEREGLDLGVQTSTESRPAQTETNYSHRKRSNTLTRVWNRYVVLTVSSSKCRDHFGEFCKHKNPGIRSLQCWVSLFVANERTALGYIRTAQAFAVSKNAISSPQTQTRSRIKIILTNGKPDHGCCHISSDAVDALFTSRPSSRFLRC